MRNVPLDVLQAMFAVEADQRPIILVTVERDGDTLRLSSDATERITVTDSDIVYGTISRSENYLYFPMEVTLSDDQEGVPLRLKIIFANATGEIGWWFLRSSKIPVVTVELVADGDVDTPIITFPDFELRPFTIGNTVSVELSMKRLEREPWPAGIMGPAHFPGLF